MFENELDVDSLTPEEIAEILAVEAELGVDISLDEIMAELEEEEDEGSDWAE